MAGALGAALWAAQQPIDKRVLRVGYDDVELLGRAVRPEPGANWQPVGWAMHVANGAVFGLAYSELRRRSPRISPMVSAPAMALAEHLALYPLSIIVDRHHPARPDLPRTFGGREFAAATWRHAILGVVLGALGARSEDAGRVRG